MTVCLILCRRPSIPHAAAVDAATVGDSADSTAAGLEQRRILQGISAERVQRLETLVELKKLYRNIIRAEALLALSSPVYTPPDGEAAAVPLSAQMMIKCGRCRSGDTAPLTMNGHAQMLVACQPRE
jgi:hypothetical protein